MEEQNLQERNRQYKARLRYIEDYFATRIDDPNIREYIFNSTDYKRCAKKVPDYVSYIDNILSLAFVFAYGCFRVDCAEEPFCCENAKKPSSLRIINSLKKAYIQYPVTSDLVQFVLTDIQFDMAQGANSELYDVFSRMCRFSDKNFSLSKYYKVIKNWRASPARFQMDANELALLFANLLDNMTFLREYNLRDTGDNFVFVEKKAELFGQTEKYSYISANHLLFKNDEKYRGFFTLFSCDKKEERVQKLLLRYISTDGYNSVNVTVSREDDPDDENHISERPNEYYEEITGSDWSTGGSSDGQGLGANFINQVHSINYKYIKNLALAVSDAISINRDSKEELLRVFRVHHPNIFFREDSSVDICSDSADWDGITVMLLIEASPTKVLEVLINKFRQMFYDIAKNLCKRIDNPDMPIYGCTDSQLDELVQKIIKSNLIVDEAGGFHRNLRNGQASKRLFAKAAAMLLISSLSSAMAEESDEKMICVGNIFENLKVLENLKNEPSPEEKEKKVSTILGETFRHLLCFYKGALAYGVIKSEFDLESCDCCLSQSRINSYQTKLKDAFMKSAKAEAERLSAYDSSSLKNTLFLIDEFIKLCKQCSSSSGGENLGRSLYVTLGKYEIMNVNDFENRTEDLFEELKSTRTFTPKTVERYTRLALDVLNFLIYGTFDCNAVNGVPLNAIYPFAATYSRGNENYDGYKTATFTLNIEIDYDNVPDTKEEVNVLTEFSYATGDVFYCLPNVLRANKKWWIDPILVSFKEFNDIFQQNL